MTISLPADALILGAALLLAGGVLGAGFADRLRFPGLLLFLALGMAIADDGLGIVTLADPLVAQVGGSIALILILYEGGLTTKPTDLRRAAGPSLVLATLGVVTTAAVVAVGAWLLLGVAPSTAMLIGAVMASTDAAAVFTVLRRAPLPRRLTAVLEVESGSNDPVAIMLTVGALETWRAAPGVADWLAFAALQIAGGLLVGLAVGLLGTWTLNRARLGAAGLYPVLALSVAGLAYGLAAGVGASGFLAVYVAGLLVGARVPRHRRNIRTFHDGLANTAEIGLFLLLGVLVFPSSLPAVALPGIAMTVVLILLARPAAVVLCLVWFGFGWRELVLLSWAGLRGAVPIVLATFPFTAGHPQGGLIFDLVFFAVLISAAVQGSTIGWLSGRLGLRDQGTVWAPVAEALPLDGVGADVVEVDVTQDLHVADKRLRDVPLPAGGLVTAVVRGSRVLVPNGNTLLQAGDLVLITMPRGMDATGSVVAWARGELAGEEPV